MLVTSQITGGVGPNPYPGQEVAMGSLNQHEIPTVQLFFFSPPGLVFTEIG